MLKRFMKAKKQKAATPEQYYNVFMQSPSGQAVLADMMKAHYFMGSTMGDTPYVTALNEGERNTVLRILTILDEYERRFE